jgi:hypothetical protein
MAIIELGPGFLIMEPVKRKRCKDCNKFDTVPGMKWGICDRRRRSSNHADTMITGPNRPCFYTNDEYEKKEESDGLLW